MAVRRLAIAIGAVVGFTGPMALRRCWLGARKVGILILFLVFSGSVACLGAVTPPGSAFPECFAHPPPESRILKIIHGWPDRPEAQDGLIERLQRQGFGGVVCNVSFDQYLESDAKWEAFVRAVRAAKEAGLALWLYDERGYPSGNAGGLVLREHPEWEARGLLVADRECDGGPVELALPPGPLFLAAAFRVQDGQINLSNRVELAENARDGKLSWTAPAGRWRVLAITESRLYEGTHAEGNLHQKMPYVNLLEPEPTQRFLTLTHQRYAERLGGDLGRYFVATFTDEPSLMSWYLKPMPWRPLPWAPNLPAEFGQRRGYALDSTVVPALIADAGPRGAKIRHDFWLTVGEMVSSHFFGQIQNRCREWNIPSGGHLLAEESLVGHVPLYGDFFRCARRLDAPSMDCLTSVPAEVPWFVARLLASAAELEGRRIVMSETSDHSQVWRGPGDNRPKRVVSAAEIRGTCNRLIISGVNAITSYYSFTDLPDDALRRLNEWVGRCCAALTGGHQVADIALMYPIESLWPRFRPARHLTSDSPGATMIEHAWRGAADSLYAAQRDFTVMDSRALVEGRVENGVLTHGNLRWRALVLPGTDTLPKAAWDNLARFARSGGVVIAVGALPANTEQDFPSPEIQSLGRELFGAGETGPSVKLHGGNGASVYLPAGSEGLLPMVLDGLLEGDVTVHAPRSPIRATHRRIENNDLYFLINDSPKPWQGELTLSGTGPGERWDPAAGVVVQTNLGARVSLNIEPYGAALFRYPAARLPQKRRPTAGPLPNLTQRPIPDVNPNVIRGEHVRAEVAADSSRATAGQPVWRATASLTQSRVDTFLFLRFQFTTPLDLDGTDCLILDTWVPEGQQTGTQLLVILQEQGGGDFIASTGGLLSAAGHHRLVVPINRLQLAGWSRDADGELDLKRVGDIRVGWGGYLGTAGERIEFSVALPQVGCILISNSAIDWQPVRE